MAKKFWIQFYFFLESSEMYEKKVINNGAHNFFSPILMNIFLHTFYDSKKKMFKMYLC